MRKITDKLIEVAVNGEFWNSENHLAPYRVKISMPDCMDEYIVTNIKRRYLFKAIKSGMEYISEEKQKENKDYYKIAKIKTLRIEFFNDNGENALILTDKVPSFYGKSIFKMSMNELQDFSTAFGLHRIPAYEDIEECRKVAFLEYLEKIKGIKEEEIKTFSFYKYDKARRRYYFEFTADELDNAKIFDYECWDMKEFEENDAKITAGKKSALDLFAKAKKKTESPTNSETYSPVSQPYNYLYQEKNKHDVDNSDENPSKQLNSLKITTIK